MKRRILVIITASVLLISMTLSCMAATFVDSIGQKLEPEISYGEVVDENLEYVKDIKEGELIIVPYSKRNDTEYAEAQKSLAEGYAEIEKAESLEEICPGLDKRADEIVHGATAKDFSVTDLVFIDYIGDVPPKAENGYIVITIDMSNYSSKYDYAYMIRDNEGNWATVDKTHMVVTENGTKAYLYVKKLGSTVAILQMNDNVIVKDPEKDSPQTGLPSNSNTAYYVAAAAVVAAAVAVTVAIVLKKKRYQ